METDNTENGIIMKLAEAGIWKEKIVLNFQSFSRRETGELMSLDGQCTFFTV